MNTLLSHLSQRSVDGASFRSISPGTKGPSVRRLQQDLNYRLSALGVLDTISVQVDGWFGPDTAVVVKYLQCVGGLPVNGYVDCSTQAFIQQGEAGLSQLSLGSVAVGVLALKQVLSSTTGLPLVRDNQFCVQTEWAVMIFQQSLGLKRDGVVGTKTWQEIVQLRLNTLPCAAVLPDAALLGT